MSSWDKNLILNIIDEMTEEQIRKICETFNINQDNFVNEIFEIDDEIFQIILANADFDIN